MSSSPIGTRTAARLGVLALTVAATALGTAPAAHAADLSITTNDAVVEADGRTKIGATALVGEDVALPATITLAVFEAADCAGDALSTGETHTIAEPPEDKRWKGGEYSYSWTTGVPGTYSFQATLDEEAAEPQSVCSGDAVIPESTDPEPTDPEPTDPEPTDPEPTDPEPSEPSTPVETATCAGETATIVGTDDAETLTGTSGRDVIVAGPGADTVNGRGGGDLICGNGGRDLLRGGGGGDELRGGSGRDDLRGGRGGDDLRGGSGKDDLRGGRGADDLRGGPGKDDLRGGRGGDDLRGGPGRDDLRGGRGGDSVRQ